MCYGTRKQDGGRSLFEQARQCAQLQEYVVQEREGGKRGGDLQNKMGVAVGSTSSGKDWSVFEIVANGEREFRAGGDELASVRCWN